MEGLTGISIFELDGRSVVIALAGEFDVGEAASLRRVFDVALDSGLPVLVDLSGVTFMDSPGVQELAAQSQLHPDRLALLNPSWQVKLSVAACNLEGWVRFGPGKSSSRGPRKVRLAPPGAGGRESGYEAWPDG